MKTMNSPTLWRLVWIQELHDEHSDYPLAPENMNVAQHLLSEHQRELHRVYYNGKDHKDEKQAKLILNLMDKDRYVVHIKALKKLFAEGAEGQKVSQNSQVSTEGLVEALD